MHKIIKIDFFTTVFFVFLLLSYIVASISTIQRLPTIGKYALLVFLLLIFALLIQKKLFAITKRELLLFLPFFIFSIIYLVNTNSIGNLNSTMIAVNQIYYLLVIYIIYSLTWGKQQIKILASLFYVSFPILFIYIFVTTDVLNHNAVASYTWLLSFFALLYLIGYAKNLKRSQIILVVVMAAAVIIASDSRSVMLSVAFGVLTFLVWKIITKRKFFFNLFFLIILAFNYFIVAIYPNLHQWQHFHTVNNWSIELTGKPIMTGRNTIWAQLVDLISLKPWLGYGSHLVPEDFLTTSLSAHNLYLQISLQTGLIGMFLLVWFFYLIWRTFWKNRYDSKVILASCFFIGILIHQSFEVTLTQNQFGIGLLQWMIIAFGLNYALNESNSKTEPM